MATIEETLAGKSDAELEQLLMRLSDDLELQRAEVGLPVDETPQQIAAKRAADGAAMPTDKNAMPAEMETETEMAPETETEVKIEDGNVTKETETEMPVADAPMLTAKLVEFGVPEKAAAEMAKVYAEAKGGEEAAMTALDIPTFTGTKNMGRLGPEFDREYGKSTGRDPYADRLSFMRGV